MKSKIIKTRSEGGASVVVTLTEFLEPNREYVAREGSYKGKKVLIIYPPEWVICDICGGVMPNFDLEADGVCDRCLSEV